LVGQVWPDTKPPNMAGRDRQLERAVEELQKQIK